MIYVIRDRATPETIKDMLQLLQTYIKLAVDVERGILAGGGPCTQIAKLFYWKMVASRNLSGALIGIRLLSK